MPDVQMMRFLVIEDWRDVAAEVWDVSRHADVERGPGEPDRLEAANLPEGGWPEVVQWLLDHPDETRCAMHAVPFRDAPLCDQPVGFVLYEDDDHPYRSGLVWRYTALVEIPHAGPETARVLAVCEDCAPDNMFTTAAWYLDQAAKAKAKAEAGFPPEDA